VAVETARAVGDVDLGAKGDRCALIKHVEALRCRRCGQARVTTQKGFGVIV
jgi:hypothetical protein